MDELLRLTSSTLYQALLSALGAVFFGAILAGAVIRLPQHWSQRIEPILVAPFFMPPLFIVLAVLNLFHERIFGLSVFGLFGILLSHWILNIPLVFYLMMRAWRQTPLETIYVAQNLGQIWNGVERPLIAQTLPRAFAIVMLYATLSFTIVLIMGGGPRSSTLEIGIYQSILFEFDLSKAVLLAGVQSVIGIGLFFVARGQHNDKAPNHAQLPNLQSSHPQLAALVTTTIGAFLIVPVIFMIVNGLSRMDALVAIGREQQLIIAFANSLAFAGMVTIFATVFALFVIWQGVTWLAWLVAAISPLAIGVFAILVIRNFANPFDWGLPIVVVIAGLTMSPLIVNIIRQRIDSIAIEERMLAQIYYPTAQMRLRAFWWPKFRGTFIRTLTIGFVLAFGDLALLPLLAPNGYENLAVIIWRLMSSYRIDAALALGTLVLLFSIGVLVLSQQVFRHAES